MKHIVKVSAPFANYLIHFGFNLQGLAGPTGTPGGVGVPGEKVSITDLPNAGERVHSWFMIYVLACVLLRALPEKVDRAVDQEELELRY